MVSRIKERLLQYKQELQKKTMYKEGLPGSSLDIVNSLLDDLEEDEKENGWISVIDRLPEIKSDYDECYLVTDGRFSWMAYWTSEKEWIFADCTNCKNKIDWKDVVAWMPLPKYYMNKNGG